MRDVNYVHSGKEKRNKNLQQQSRLFTVSTRLYQPSVGHSFVAHSTVILPLFTLRDRDLSLLVVWLAVFMAGQEDSIDRSG